MLVLSRKPDEKILIGETITITVLKIRGNTVRLGIEAPREISVVRGELDTKRNQAAANQAVPATVEFRSNSDGSQKRGPSIRVVGQEMELDRPEEPEPAANSIPLNRLSQFVCRLSENSRVE